MTQPKAYFFIESQWDNLGDALICCELIKLMARHADVTLGVRLVPENFRKMMGVEFLKSFTLDEKNRRSAFLLKILMRRLRSERSYLFLSPGGWIGELDGNLNLRSWVHSFLYHLLAIAGVKICQAGISYEDIGPKLSLMLRVRSGAMASHHVRDQKSRDVITQKGVRVDGIRPDLAFNAFQDIGERNAQPGISFSFRGQQYPGQLEDIKAVIAKFMTGCDAKIPVYFVTQVQKDSGTNEQLLHWFQSQYTNPAVLDDGSEIIEETQKLYARSHVIVSNRLHSLLLAGSVGNYTIAAPIGEHNKKIRALYEDMGIPEQVFGSADMPRYNDEMNKNSDHHFHAYAASAKKQLQDHFKILIGER